MAQLYTRDLVEFGEDGIGCQDHNCSVRDIAQKLYGHARGFILTKTCYRSLLDRGGLGIRIKKSLEKLQPVDPESLAFWSEHVRRLILGTHLPDSMREDLELRVHEIASRMDKKPEFAVHAVVLGENTRRKAFRGRGLDGLCQAVLESYATLFDADVIEHRKRLGFEQLDVTLLVSIRSTTGLELSRIAKGK